MDPDSDPERMLVVVMVVVAVLGDWDEAVV